MPLPAKELDEVLAMSGPELDVYFEDYARYMEENPPESQYAIRFGSRALWNGDTAELKKEFLRRVRKAKRERDA